MKTLKTLGMLLLVATGLMAQPNPDNMFVSGYVVDGNGQAQNGQEVCVYYTSNNPALPSDTICTTTNANGYYFIDVQNGSLSGPNVTFTVYTIDPCSFTALTETRQNYQGTIDTANVNFTLCANAIPCDASFTTSIDSSNGVYIGTFQASATGQAPITFQWWIDGSVYTTQNVIHTFLGGTVGVYLTVTDATGCTAMYGDTLYLDGGQNSCMATIDVDSTLFGVTLTANSTGVAPFTYLWNSGETTAQISNLVQDSTYCVTVTDASGCMATECYTFPPNQGNCFASFWYQTDQNGNVVVADTLNVFYGGSISGTNSYQWTLAFGGQVWTASTQDFAMAIPPTVFPIIGYVEVDVCVTVTDSLENCSDTYCETLTLVPDGSNGCSGFIFADGSLGPNSSVHLMVDYIVGVAPFTFNWNTGETTQDITVYQPGLYCVEVTDATGCSFTVCDSVVGTSVSCYAEFVWAESNILGSPLPAIEFTDQSYNASYWYWDFGDNTFSTSQNPLHTYNSSGLYLVCLTIVSADQSCQQTFCDSVYVGTNSGGNCNAAFSSTGPTPIGYTFSANVQDPNLYYYWTIDNQYVGDGYEAIAPGLSNGVHTICLMVIDSLNNCSDQECQTITVGSNNCYGYISGQVYAGSNNQPLDQGVVYLITYDANTNQLTAVDSMVVDSGNYYFFGPVACGDYLIKAAAYAGSQHYGNHIPTYYGNSPFWGFAQTISIGQVNVQVSADIFLIAANNPGGPGFIGGDVTQGANKMDEGDPVAGMQVMLFSLNGNAVAYAYTDANGEFGFSNLAYGTYQVYVEALGVQTIPAIVTIGENEPSVEDVHILASETLITTGIEEFDFEGAISEVYPNPVGADASINFNLETEVQVDVRILDLAGRTISTRTISVSSGENTVLISTEGLNDGYYFLNIQDADGAFSVTRKFMRVD